MVNCSIIQIVTGIEVIVENFFPKVALRYTRNLSKAHETRESL